MQEKIHPQYPEVEINIFDNTFTGKCDTWSLQETDGTKRQATPAEAKILRQEFFDRLHFGSLAE